MRGASSATGTSCIASHFQGAAINGAIAAIDIALRDIKGKALGVPVHSLLDGPCRTEARVYGHAYGRMIAELVANCTALKEAGFNAVDHVNPFLDEGEDRPFFRTHVRNMTRAVEAVRRVREALGDDVDLLLELHRRLTPAEAVDFIPRIERYLPFWCEDPSRPENVNAMARVARRVRAPIARRASATPPCTTSAPSSRGAGAAQYARIDVALCGGITGARKVAALAEAQHVQVAPHNPLSPLGLAACLHLAAAIPNFAIQEYTTGFEALKMESSPRLLGSDVVHGVPPMKGGFVAIPRAGPGRRDRAGRGAGPPVDPPPGRHAPPPRRLRRRPNSPPAQREISRRAGFRGRGARRGAAGVVRNRGRPDPRPSRARSSATSGS